MTDTITYDAPPPLEGCDPLECIPGMPEPCAAEGCTMRARYWVKARERVECGTHARDPTAAPRPKARTRTCAICGGEIGPDTGYQCRCSMSEPADGMGPQGEDWLEACASRYEE